MSRWISTLPLSLVLLGYGCDIFLEEDDSRKALEPIWPTDSSVSTDAESRRTDAEAHRTDAEAHRADADSSGINPLPSPTKLDASLDSEESEIPFIDDLDSPEGSPGDSDNEECGNGRVSETETCDTAIDHNIEGACPTECPPTTGCTILKLQGLDCQAACVEVTTVDCIDDDGCCPDSCSNDNDNDCHDVICGDQIVSSPHETCDPPDSCPTSCQTANDCETVELIGDPDMCTAECVSRPIRECQDDDGCCPDTCTIFTDTDCDYVCGDGIITSPHETCDPPDTCPTTCVPNNLCEFAKLNGEPENCTAECIHVPFECTDGDGCCPEQCTVSSDNDCPDICGDGIISGPDETCDPPDTCPTSCASNNPCVIAELEGEPENCTVYCKSKTVTQCTNDDQCCPEQCTVSSDNDCPDICGDGIISGPDETCDPPDTCPTSCAPNNPCEFAELEGKPENCTAECIYFPFECIDGDGCCPENCTFSNDDDCSPF